MSSLDWHGEQRLRPAQAWQGGRGGQRGADNPNAVDPFLRGRAERLLGMLALAAEDLIAMVDGDLHQLRAGTRSHDEARIDALRRLPPQFLSRYDSEFTERFLASVADLRGRLGRSPWEPPSCVAQELGLRLPAAPSPGADAVRGVVRSVRQVAMRDGLWGVARTRICTPDAVATVLFGETGRDAARGRCAGQGG